GLRSWSVRGPWSSFVRKSLGSRTMSLESRTMSLESRTKDRGPRTPRTTYGRSTKNQEQRTRLHPSVLSIADLDPVAAVVESLAVGGVACLARLPQCARRRFHRIPLGSRDIFLDRLGLRARVVRPADRVGLALRLPERFGLGECLLEDRRVLRRGFSL